MLIIAKVRLTRYYRKVARDRQQTDFKHEQNKRGTNRIGTDKKHLQNVVLSELTLPLNP